MARTITAQLFVNDDADPPVVHVTVTLDSATVASRDLTPAEAVAAIGVVALDAPEALAAVNEIVTRLGTNVQQGAAAQAARAQALQDWRDAIATHVPPSPPAPA